MGTIRVVALVLVFAAPLAGAQPDPAMARDSVVQVAVLDGDSIRRLGSGFAVANDYVLTAAHLVANEDSVVVVPLSTGAELVARTVHVDERADLALLAVNALGLPTLKLASDGFDQGRNIFSAGVWSDSGERVVVAQATEDVTLAVVRGSVARHYELAVSDEVPALLLAEHNAMIPAAGYGGPLLNECGEVAGMNRGTPGVSAWRLRRGQAPEGVVHVLRAESVAALLEVQGIEYEQVEQSCVDALDAARTQAEETRQQLEQSRQELEEITGQTEETRQQLEQAQQDKEQAAAAAAEAQARVEDLESQYEEAQRSGDEQAEALRAELEAARGEQEATRAAEERARVAVNALQQEMAALEQRMKQEAELARKRVNQLVAIAGGVVAVIAVVAFIAIRRRARQLALAREEAARARQMAADARARPLEHESPFPDCVLTGETGDGHPVSVKIPGALLGGDGAIIGRSPRNSTLLIDDPTLSREHARLFGERDLLYVEDLDTTNGTRVNGRVLQPRAPASIGAGDTLEFGAVGVTLSLGG